MRGTGAVPPQLFPEEAVINKAGWEWKVATSLAVSTAAAACARSFAAASGQPRYFVSDFCFSAMFVALTGYELLGGFNHTANTKE